MTGDTARLREDETAALRVALLPVDTRQALRPRQHVNAILAAEFRRLFRMRLRQPVDPCLPVALGQLLGGELTQALADPDTRFVFLLAVGQEPHRLHE